MPLMVSFCPAFSVNVALPCAFSFSRYSLPSKSQLNSAFASAFCSDSSPIGVTDAMVISKVNSCVFAISLPRSPSTCLVMLRLPTLRVLVKLAVACGLPAAHSRISPVAVLVSLSFTVVVKPPSL